MAALRPAGRPEPANPFASAAVLREQASAEAAEALEPIVAVIACLAVAALVAAGYALWAALAHVDQCLALARV